MSMFHSKEDWIGTPAERQDLLMGTAVSQRVYGIGGELCAERVREEIMRLEQLWSVFRRDSEVSELARRAGGEALEVAPDTASLLAHARELNAITEGAFDVTLGPALKLWRAAAVSGRVPNGIELDAARLLVRGRDIELTNERRVRLARPGQSLDFGAIGKGYAADNCCAIYRQHGIRHAFLNLGGNVAVVGTRPDGTPWRVGIQAPDKPRGVTFGYLEVCDTSVVTSGSYERSFAFGGQRFSHIIDPRTALPVADRSLSVTVMSRSSMLADALSTALTVMGASAALRYAYAHELDVIVCSERDGISMTPGMAAVFQAR
jgi:thiamine biosynthesis lipoprotein